MLMRLQSRAADLFRGTEGLHECLIQLGLCTFNPAALKLGLFYCGKLSN